MIPSTLKPTGPAILKLKEILSDHYSGFLNSYAMVFFSNNRLFAWILFAVTFFDPYAGLSGLISLLTANAVANILGLNLSYIRLGYYGFNALLVGLGIGLNFQFSFELVILLIFSSLLTLFITVMLEGIIGKYSLPYLTLPFLFSFWMVTLAARYYTGLHISERGVYQINELYSLGGDRMLAINEWFNKLPLAPSLVTYFRSLSAIFFQYHLLTGMLVAAGLIWYSRIAFILSLIGFYSAFLFYNLVGANFNELNYSFIGFNYILTAIAIGGFFIVPSRTSFLWVILLTPLISILVTSSSVFLANFQLSTYSLPFNLMVLLFLYGIRYREKPRSGLKQVTLQEFSPEKNLYSNQNIELRFPAASIVPIQLPVMGEWTITQGHSGEHTHQDSWRHAWDLEITDDSGVSYSGKGLETRDYYCYGKPVIAPADGWVEEIQDNIDDNVVGELNLENNWGNAIIIRHSDHLYTKICHLQKGSFKVSKNSAVKKGEMLALCGNSGRSPFPHVHFQVQSTPYIGSPTLEYPVSQYIVKNSSGFEMKSYSFPEKGERVSNLIANSSLAKAFDFKPGEEIRFSVSSNNRPSVIVDWEVKADIYNRTYILCRQSGSKAYFQSNNEQFFFTWFDGKKSSLLYYFYLGAYRVAKGFYPKLLIRDTFPLQNSIAGIGKLLQDFVSPFYLFIKNVYEIRYISMKDELQQSGIQLHSLMRSRYWFKELTVRTFELEIDHDSIERILVSSGKYQVAAERYKSGNEKPA